MLNSYFLRYRIRFNGQDTFLTMEVAGHYRNPAQVREDYDSVCPVMFQDQETQEKLKFKLLSVRENTLGPYWDS